MASMQTWLLIGLNVLASWLAFERPRLLDRLVLWPPAVTRKHEYDRLVTYGFVHADWQHLSFNMITLYFFGRLAEQYYADAMGPLGFPFFYITALIVAVLPTFLKHRNDAAYRTLGASGAVAAVLFTYVLVNPWGLIFVFFIPCPAVVYGVLYLGYSAWADRQARGNVNHSAHFWGAAYGIAFAIFANPDVVHVFLGRLAAPVG